ncbi:MAG: S8 family serine peptidase, partial [Muribaculaceae bacterium]|nr:S8 family serine peptidase [Muribaculaceae bacterium]
PEVKALSFGERRYAKLDLARKGTGVETIHQGTEFEFPYKGKGVITGIYDTGLDPNHANFCDADGNTRVARVFSYSGSSGQVNTYSSPERIARFTTDNSQETHGTHTTGCMAGSFNRRGGGTVVVATEAGDVSCSARNYNPYYGMAPEATLAIGCGALYDANITAGVSEIVNYAAGEGLPCVINLSIGSSIGPHDGSDATSQMLDRLGEKAIICIAAGNEGDMPMSVSKTFTTDDTSVSTVFSGGDGATGYVDIWSSTSDPMTLTVMVVDRTTGKISFSQEIPVTGDDNKLIATTNKNNGLAYTGGGFDKAFQSSTIQIYTSDNAATNRRMQARLSVNCVNNIVTNVDGNRMLALKVSGKAGQRVDITTNSTKSSFTDAGLEGFTAGSGSFSISSMACGKKVLVVGAWNTR